MVDDDNVESLQALALRALGRATPVEERTELLKELKERGTMETLVDSLHNDIIMGIPIVYGNLWYIEYGKYIRDEPIKASFLGYDPNTHLMTINISTPEGIYFRINLDTGVIASMIARVKDEKIYSTLTEGNGYQLDLSSYDAYKYGHSTSLTLRYDPDTEYMKLRLDGWYRRKYPDYWVILKFDINQYEQLRENWDWA